MRKTLRTPRFFAIDYGIDNEKRKSGGHQGCGSLAVTSSYGVLLAGLAHLTY